MARYTNTDLVTSEPLEVTSEPSDRATLWVGAAFLLVLNPCPFLEFLNAEQLAPQRAAIDPLATRSWSR